MAWESYPASGEPLRASKLQALIAQLVPLGAVKTATETVNGSDVLQNDDELFVAAAANVLYAYRGMLIWTSGTTPDLKLDLSIPAGASHWSTAATWSRAAAGGTQLVDTRNFVTGENIGIPGQGTSVSTQGQTTLLVGYVSISSTAGNVQVRWAQNVSNASNTVMYPGSWLHLQKLV